MMCIYLPNNRTIDCLLSIIKGVHALRISIQNHMICNLLLMLPIFPIFSVIKSWRCHLVNSKQFEREFSSRSIFWKLPYHHC